MESLSHHAGGARNQGSPQLQYRDQSVGKERTYYGQHIHRLHRFHRFCKTLCAICRWFLFPFFAFEFSALQKTDEFACSAHDRDRTNPIPSHQLLRIIEGCVWFDKETWSNRAHDVAGAREVPPLTWQGLEIFERKHSVQTLVLCNRKRNLPVDRQNRINQITD